MQNGNTTVSGQPMSIGLRVAACLIRRMGGKVFLPTSYFEPEENNQFSMDEDSLIRALHTEFRKKSNTEIFLSMEEMQSINGMIIRGEEYGEIEIDVN